MKKEKTERTVEQRRAFLKLAALAPAAAAAAAVGAPSAAAAEEKPTELGYRETEHVKKYFASLEF